jgi:hypothetical protein
MSEPKNIKRNKSRPKAKNYALVSSMQRNYSKPKLPEKTATLW